MTRTYTVKELAEHLGGELRGDGAAGIRGVADVSEAGPHEATWVSRPEYASRLAGSRAGVVLVPKNFGPTPMPTILCESVDRAVARLLGAFATPLFAPAPGIHPMAAVDPSAEIGDGTAIGPNAVVGPGSRLGRSCVLHAGVYVGRNVTIGDEAVLWPGSVVLDRCALGRRVVLYAGAVVGSDGFGYYWEDGRHHKVPHIGGVILEDDVEVGACACIDRAKFGNTVVGRGTKIDNLVQIAHNVRVGADCVLAGQAGVGGSVRIGDGCSFGGQVGVTDNLRIGEGASFGARSLVNRDIEPGQTFTGWPIQEIRRALRTQALMIRLPELADQIKQLLARVERLEGSKDHSA